MRRILFSSAFALAGMLILAVPHGRGPSIEQLFVAQTQAASDADATCTMPPDGGQEQPRLAIPTSSDTT